MRKYREWREVLVEQLVERGNVIGYLEAVIAEYQIHGNIAAVQKALESAIEAQREISRLAENTPIESQVLLKKTIQRKGTEDRYTQNYPYCTWMSTFYRTLGV